jgi:hypothetical protein
MGATVGVGMATQVGVTGSAVAGMTLRSVLNLMNLPQNIEQYRVKKSVLS